MTGPRYVINFSTKQHWHEVSRIDFIEDGLDDLAATIGRLGVRSVAVPALESENGGLAWAQMRPLIEQKVGSLDVDVWVYPSNA